MQHNFVIPDFLERPHTLGIGRGTSHLRSAGDVFRDVGLRFSDLAGCSNEQSVSISQRQHEIILYLSFNMSAILTTARLIFKDGKARDKAIEAFRNIIAFTTPHEPEVLQYVCALPVDDSAGNEIYMIEE